MDGAAARYLDGGPDGRLHLQHGPIDLIIGVDGLPGEAIPSGTRQRAFEAARRRFATILDELVAELAFLRNPAAPDGPDPQGTVARRMTAAVRPLSGRRFITPMAAVAGAVADEIRDAMLAAFPPGECPPRIHVNNGGDIALHLSPQATFHIAMSGEDGTRLGTFAMTGAERERGIATSGRGGRSFSLGIADSVTVVAASAAQADAAATLIANAVDLPGHPAIIRCPASRIAPDSDLGDRLVTRDCGSLTAEEIDRALDAGLAEADHLIARGLIRRAALFLKNEGRIADRAAAFPPLPEPAFPAQPHRETIPHA
ncbi:UPF0280 family protein [Rhizobiaceae bacterium BDR2-2]|uniref:UPF0280 family protein n=1 Tax=Ectorhizobium quercum TaxID=2965071 RepID=A0AAE3MZJ0_9HYPH|nr:UPF0280 family protein [Ectorhizobium quercum]MCX8997978.1 UPF0280 family protein [Ectorhizobium quercum]